MHNREIVPEDDNRYLTDWMAEKANEFIAAQKVEPFFLYVAFNAVHTPMQAPPELLKEFPDIRNKKRQKLAGMTLSLDRAVGSILDTLNKQGLDGNTIVFFLNDNGGATTNASDNGPLRGMKGSKWEGGIRVPFVVRWTNHLRPRRYDRPVSSLDIAATSLAIAGEIAENMGGLDGKNILPYIAGNAEGEPHDVLYWRRGPAAAIRQGKWKLIRVETNPHLLFNLDEDLGETTNLAPHYPQKVVHLLALLEKWEGEMVEPLWVADQKWQDNQVKKHKMDVVGRDTERKIP